MLGWDTVRPVSCRQAGDPGAAGVWQHECRTAEAAAKQWAGTISAAGNKGTQEQLDRGMQDSNSCSKPVL
jgi:hypothetical protein